MKIRWHLGSAIGQRGGHDGVGEEVDVFIGGRRGGGRGRGGRRHAWWHEEGRGSVRKFRAVSGGWKDAVGVDGAGGFPLHGEGKPVVWLMCDDKRS